MEGIKGEKSEQQSDKAEYHHQNGIDSGRFQVQKVKFLIKNDLWLYAELCFLPERGTQFQRFHETKLPESEQWSPNNVGIHQNTTKMVLETSRCHQNHAGYTIEVAQGGHL